MPHQLYRSKLKRYLDLAGATLVLVILAPILALISMIIRLRLGAPVLFRQRRPGLSGKPFTLYKFRTMVDAFDGNGNPLSDAARLTKFGHFLRSTSLDELPGFFNILKGEMSLVGPRPLLLHYLDYYTPEQARRHEVKPGITGWAQVNGRNIITWEQKFALDVWYVDHLSFWLDLKIILLTAWKILTREGISHPGHVTVEQFARPKN